MRSIVLVFIVAGVATALNCYQGIQNASQPVSGSATACPTPALSCLKAFDNSTNTVTRYFKLVGKSQYYHTQCLDHAKQQIAL